VVDGRSYCQRVKATVGVNFGAGGEGRSQGKNHGNHGGSREQVQKGGVIVG